MQRQRLVGDFGGEDFQSGGRRMVLREQRKGVCGGGGRIHLVGWWGWFGVEVHLAQRAVLSQDKLKMRDTRIDIETSSYLN